MAWKNLVKHLSFLRVYADKVKNALWASPRHPRILHKTVTILSGSKVYIHLNLPPSLRPPLNDVTQTHLLLFTAVFGITDPFRQSYVCPSHELFL